MAEKKEYITLKTPFLVARYPKWDKTDTYKGEDTLKYVVQGVAHDDESFAKFKAEIDAAADKLWGAGAAKARKNAKKTPLREDDKTGVEFFKFTTKKKPILFGPKGGVKLPEGVLAKVGSGTVFRAEISLTESNGHIAGYVNGIQIKQLVERGSGGFDDVEGDDIDLPASSGFDDTDEDEGNGLDL